MPFFSIIIPLYNKEKFILNTLNSVLNQSFTDFEIIVVNDGSTDNGVAIVSQLNHPKIIVLNQTNKGVSAARNLGIENASGELIAFLDADDYWFPNHLEVVHSLYHDFPKAGMYCSRYKIKFAENNFHTPKYLNISDDYRGIVADYFYSSCVDRIGWTSIVTVPKTVLQSVANFNERVSNGQDLELWIKIALKLPVVVSNTITANYHYEVNDSLAKRNILNKKLMDFNQFSEEETKNPSLKKFLDVYRIEYALHFHTLGDSEKKAFYLKDVNPNNMAIKTKILFYLPSFVLIQLLRIKRFLKTIGVNFTVYR